MQQQNQNISGYTLIELLMAVIVGAIVLAGAYSSYLIVARQFDKNRSVSEIRDMAIPTITILSRDLRMAGSKYVDGDIESTFGRIDNPIVINQNPIGNFDSFSIVFDRRVEDPVTLAVDTVRTRKTYYVQARTNPIRNALYLDIEVWDGVAWVASDNAILVSDYIESFKIEGENNNDDGFPTLVHFNLVFRSKDKLATSDAFVKAEYGVGGSLINVTDNYRREEFESSVYLRNLADRS
jgi:prepilin-type N-terminal cleavage/methylation domain-containing protein